ncbi:hypothetical protein [Biostraticola tofi]|uniref:Uncharacterized protein n=1 Tax=Biostraticola tofi TaxID=466109 RepID=A0A4R3Z727_9GAMM|nr:hypothetical protein [Biostraticola tofi]TCW00305.1 hypothetical protein EDC52_101654 [Biostraticola tofi]
MVINVCNSKHGAPSDKNDRFIRENKKKSKTIRYVHNSMALIAGEKNNAPSPMTRINIDQKANSDCHPSCTISQASVLSGTAFWLKRMALSIIGVCSLGSFRQVLSVQNVMGQRENWLDDLSPAERQEAENILFTINSTRNAEPETTGFRTDNFIAAAIKTIAHFGIPLLNFDNNGSSSNAVLPWRTPDVLPGSPHFVHHGVTLPSSAYVRKDNISSVSHKKTRSVHRFKRESRIQDEINPPCKKNIDQSSFWSQVADNIEQFWSVERTLKRLTNQAPEKPLATVAGPKSNHTQARGLHLKDGNERHRLMHTFGLSDEFPLDQHAISMEYIDRILNTELLTSFGFMLSQQDYNTSIPVVINRITATDADHSIEPPVVAWQGKCTIRELLLNEPIKKLRMMNGASEIDYQYLLSPTTKVPGMADNFIFDIQFIANGGVVDIDKSLHQMLDNIKADKNINDAFITMAKNRFASAFLPYLIYRNKDGSKLPLINDWLSGNLTESLLGVYVGKHCIMVPNVIAITQPTGGYLVSISTGEVYLWEPDDDSETLKNFINYHLSIKNADMFNKAEKVFEFTVDGREIYSHYCFLCPNNIWQKLRDEVYRTAHEHLAYFDAGQPLHLKKTPIINRQRTVTSAATVIMLLSLFKEGASEAGCASLLMSNLMLGASMTAFDVATAVTTENHSQRSRAWKSALSNFVLTMLCGGVDAYSFLKFFRQEQHAGLLELADFIKEKIAEGLSDVELELTSASLIFSDAKNRFLHLIRTLTGSRLPHFESDNKSMEAMVKMMTVAGLTTRPLGGTLHNLAEVNDHFGEMVAVTGLSQIRDLDFGYQFAVTELENENVIIMMISLGHGSLAGYDLGLLTDSAELQRGWQYIRYNKIILENNLCKLSDGRHARLWRQSTTPSILADFKPPDAYLITSLSTKFSRRCADLKKIYRPTVVFSKALKFTSGQGFNNVHHRVLYLWNREGRMHQQVFNLITAKKAGVLYILDPMSEERTVVSSGVLTHAGIYENQDWVQGIESLQSHYLIRYNDFPNFIPSEGTDAYYWRPDNDRWLITPPELVDAEPLTYTNIVNYSLHHSADMLSSRQRQLDNALRKAIIKQWSGGDNFDFIYHVLHQAGVINKNAMSLQQRFAATDPIIALRLLAYDFERITTLDDLLRVQPGMLVSFTKTTESSKGVVMLSMGNGRFACRDHRLLNPAFHQEPRILVAEQLGTFSQSLLQTDNGPDLFIVEKALPWEGKHRTLEFMATELGTDHHRYQNSHRFVFDLLLSTNSLVPQQATALASAVDTLLSELQLGMFSRVKMDKFLANSVSIYRMSDFKRIELGKLVILIGDPLPFHMMISLGNNRFAGVGNQLINNALKAEDIIVSAETLGYFEAGQLQIGDQSFKIYTGDANLPGTRIGALLGPDSQVRLIGDGSTRLRLKIKAHGALSSVNHYDGCELADIVQGLYITGRDVGRVSSIELVSCYGALGGEQSTAQILADRLGLPVESYRGIINDITAQRREFGVQVLPHANWGRERIMQNERWHLRIHNAVEVICRNWQKLAARRKSRESDDAILFELVIVDIISFLRGKLSAADFMQRQPNYSSLEVLLTSSRIMHAVDNPESMKGALMALLYGTEKMANGFAAYLIEQDANAEALTVHSHLDGDSLCEEVIWSQPHPDDLPIHTLGPFIALKPLIAHDQIFITQKDWSGHSSEAYLITVGELCHKEQDWPIMLANFFIGHVKSKTVMIGYDNTKSDSHKTDDSANLFYIKNASKNNFDLQIVLNPIRPDSGDYSLADFQAYDPGKGLLQFVTPSEAFDFNFNDFNKAIRISDFLANKTLNTADDKPSVRPTKYHFHGHWRFIIEIMEQGERMILLQRTIPEAIAESEETLAFYLATEINKYTALIKVGVKQGNQITPALSATANEVFIHPLHTNTSWIMLKVLVDYRK